MNEARCSICGWRCGQPSPREALMAYQRHMQLLHGNPAPSDDAILADILRRLLAAQDDNNQFVLALDSEQLSFGYGIDLSEAEQAAAGTRAVSKPNIWLVLEGTCPDCGGQLQPSATCGWCASCQRGWSHDGDTAGLHDAPDAAEWVRLHW